MERKDFLKAAGLAGLGTMLPFNKTKAAEIEKTELQLLEDELTKQGACIATPADMEGPYPLDLSNKQNGKFFRQQINEGKAGVPLNFTFRVYNFNDGCKPVPNVRVDAWHCDAQGLYSGYANQTGHTNGGSGQNLTGLTFCRGIQLTDRNGIVTFNSIYPGWYFGRAVHIHMNFFVNTTKQFTTQCCFENRLNNDVFTTNSSIYGGPPNTTNEQDQIFADGVQYQTLTVAKNSSGGYDASLDVYLKLPKGTDVVDLDPKSYRQLVVRQNYPNPFNLATTIPFTLTNPSEVSIDIYDLTGRKVHSVLNQHFEAGEQKVLLNNRANGLNLAPGNYVYQVSIENIAGNYHQCKVLAVE